MEFTSQKQLYNKLLPVFKVKNRLIKYSKYQHITNENIWYYLIETKWKKAHNLQISEIINDIITLDLEEINQYINESSNN